MTTSSALKLHLNEIDRNTCAVERQHKRKRKKIYIYIWLKWASKSTKSVFTKPGGETTSYFMS